MNRPTVFLHIGEPKSGTTFVQQVMWANRDVLARHGVLLPGMHPQDHFRANQDLREVPQEPSDPTGSYLGEWDLLAKQAMGAERAAVISHELLAAATDAQAARAIATLEGADVHIVLSLRDFVSLLPAEWQETVKHRNTLRWEDWLRRVRRAEHSSRRGMGRWFWRVHDTPDVIRRWTPGIPADHVHLLTLPGRGAPPELLWERFASIIGVAGAPVDFATARPNASLGLAEVEMLRRLNEHLGDDVSHYHYAIGVKERLAHGYLASRPASARPVLPRDVRTWAEEHARNAVAVLREGNYDVVGDLDELLPRDGAASSAAARSAVATEDVLDAAVGALATVLRDQAASPADAAVEGRARDTQLGPGMLPPRFKRVVRDLTSRHPLVGRIRLLAWRWSERARSRRRGR